MKRNKAVVLVGSTNPVKIKAVKEVFQYIVSKVKVQGIKVESGVANQPLSFEEAYIGALNRAKNIKRENNKADYYIGIEGTLQKHSFGWTTGGLVVIIDNNEKIGVGISSQILIPDSAITKIKKGKELGDVLDKITGRENVKQQEGAFGLFTKNLISRKDAYTHAIASALSKFIRKELYI